eukprot:Seg1717.3 transcript_id=Seg1717.3/GoldUCD/mRNA.D3Y31 product="Zinc finger protein 366" protein_id=Seg1717.3/GoldUCD/D3Y31
MGHRAQVISQLPEKDASIESSPNSTTTQNDTGNAHPSVVQDVPSQRARSCPTGDAVYWASHPGTTLHYLSSASNVDESPSVDKSHQQFFEYESIPEGQSNCPICNAHFTKRWNLLRHYRAHGDARPFKCSICGRLFKETGHLNQHMITHRNNNKPYECEMCHASYTRNESLKNHMHKFHGIALENVGIQGFERGHMSEREAFSVTEKVCSTEVNFDLNLQAAKDRDVGVALIGSESEHSRNSRHPDDQELYDGLSDISQYSDNFPDDSETDTAEENEDTAEQRSDYYDIKTTVPGVEKAEYSAPNDRIKRSQKLYCNRSSHFGSMIPREAAPYKHSNGPVQSHSAPTVDSLQKAVIFHCQFCEFEFHIESMMEEHISNEHPNETFKTSHITYRCPICALRCENEKSLSSHFARVHPTVNFDLACKFCGIFFTNETYYMQHAKLHGKGSIPCVYGLTPGNSVSKELLNNLEIEQGMLNKERSPVINVSNRSTKDFPTVSAVFQAESLEHPTPLHKLPQQLIKAGSLESLTCKIQREHHDGGNDEGIDACQVVSPCTGQKGTSLKSSFTTIENDVKSASPDNSIFSEEDNKIVILKRNDEGLQSVSKVDGYYCTVCNKMQENRAHVCSPDHAESNDNGDLDRQWQAAQPMVHYSPNIYDEFGTKSLGFVYMENNGNKFLEEVKFSMVPYNMNGRRTDACGTVGRLKNRRRTRAPKGTVGKATYWNYTNGQMVGIPNVYVTDSPSVLFSSPVTPDGNSVMQKMDPSDVANHVATTADQNNNVPDKDSCGTPDKNENSMTSDSDILKLASFVSFANIYNHIQTPPLENPVDQSSYSQSPQKASLQPAAEDSSSVDVSGKNNNVLEMDPCPTTTSAVSIEDDASTECFIDSKTERKSKRTRKRPSNSIMQGLANKVKAKKRKKYTRKKQTPKVVAEEILRICQSCGLQRPIDHKCSLSDPKCETGVGTRCDFCGGIKLEFHVCRRTEQYPFKCLRRTISK